MGFNERENRTIWVKIEFEQLKPDDEFRMFEPTGEPVIGVDGIEIFKAIGYPYKFDGVNAIEISEINQRLSNR